MSALEEQIAQLEAAIAAQEALRDSLGDAVVDAAVAVLGDKLGTLRAQQASSAGAMAPEQLLARLQSYLPQGLADKMRATGRIEGERRQVTVLFADISGFTALSERLDPEEVVTLSNDVLKELAEAVYQYEGYVDKFLGDAVMAVFGAPVAHEDDAERALRATLDMRERFERFNRRWIDRLGQPLSLHVGVNTGTVIAGNVGTDLRMSYTVMGDTVNTASRLESAAAPGQVLVSRDTYRLTRGGFIFLATEPIRVKGKREPLAVYELQGARLAPRKVRGLRDLASAFVGRGREMGQLRAVMEGLEAGRGHIVVVSGEAGIGKSRLMAEWRREITVGGRATWAEGRCLAYTASVSYGPFLDLMRRYAGIRDEQSEDAARWRLDVAAERFFPGDVEAKAVFANLLAFRLSPQESESLESLPGEQLRRRTFDLMEALFAQLAEARPTVLVIEDMHWADASSLELVEHLLPLVQRRPLAVVGVSRQRPDDVAPLSAAREAYAGHFTAITLSSLSEATSLEMVARLLTLDELPPPLKRLILDKAEGNPFFVEEVVRTLIERGALVQAEDGAWQVTPLIETLAVPDTLHGLLMARLDRLPPETKWLAQQASVIGRIFLYRVLRQMAESEVSLDDGLSRMERDDLIRERARDPELEYMFRHALTQEVAYESLLAARRQELHRRVGEAMEELFSERIAEFATVIGEHYLHGEAWEQAFDYLVRAGDAAAQLYANAEARLHFTRALDALAKMADTEENRRRRVDTIIRLTAAVWRAESPEENLARLAEAERLVRQLSGPDGTPGGDRLRLARVHFWMGRVHYARGENREAIGYYQQVLPVAQESDDPELLAIPANAIGMVMNVQGRLGKSMALFRQAIPLLEQTGNWPDWVRAVALCGGMLAAMGEYERGVAKVQRAIARAREMDSPTEIALATLPLSFAHLFGGDLLSAIEAACQAIEVAEQSGDRVYVYIGYGAKGWAEGRFGLFEDAINSMALSQTAAQELGGAVMMADWFAAGNAEIAFGAGQVREALALAEQAVGIAQKMDSIVGGGIARRAWGQALAALPDPHWDEAEAQLAASLRVLESGQNRLEAARTHVAWGQVCRDRGDLAAAREHWEQAAAQWKKSELPWELEKVQALIASLPEAQR